MESFVGKGIRFFQILDHVIKKQLDVSQNISRI
jgi:hypothetical protein